MISRCCLVLASLLLAMSGSATQQGSKLPSVDTMLSWLPPDTETVIVTTKQISPEEMPNGRQSDGAPLKFSMLGLQGLGLPLDLPVDGLTFESAVDGSRFTHVKGQDRYLDECKILRLPSADVARLSSFVSRKAVRRTHVHGLPVTVIEGEGDGEQGKMDYYFVFQGRLMFCATDEPFLNEVLSRRAHGGKGRALPESLPIWRYVNKSSPLWVASNYAHDTRLAMQHIWAEGADPQGFAISLNPAGTAVTVVAITGTPKGADALAKTWTRPLDENHPGSTLLENTRPDPCTMRLLFNATDNHGDDALFMMLMAAGHFPIV